jgi:hypothetical protein
MPREVFRREVEKELTGKEEEPSDLIYFKVYKSQMPVIEQAIETATLMLGTDFRPVRYGFAPIGHFASGKYCAASLRSNMP